jgi:hypothetical protein
MANQKGIKEQGYTRWYDSADKGIASEKMFDRDPSILKGGGKAVQGRGGWRDPSDVPDYAGARSAKDNRAFDRYMSGKPERDPDSNQGT